MSKILEVFLDEADLPKLKKYGQLKLGKFHLKIKNFPIHQIKIYGDIKI